MEENNLIGITGSTGSIGSYASNSHETIAIQSRLESDLQNIADELKEKKINSLIHLAGLSDPEECEKNPDHCFRGWNDAWLHPDFREWNVADCLDYIRVPVLAIQGHDDQYGSMAQLDEIAERCYSPVEQLRLDACRHAPHLDHPEKTTAAIAAFTDRIAAINAID